MDEVPALGSLRDMKNVLRKDFANKAATSSSSVRIRIWYESKVAPTSYGFVMIKWTNTFIALRFVPVTNVLVLSTTIIVASLLMVKGEWPLRFTNSIQVKAKHVCKIFWLTHWSRMLTISRENPFLTSITPIDKPFISQITTFFQHTL